MTKAQCDETLKTLTEQGVLKTSVPVDDVFTDKFLAGGWVKNGSFKFRRRATPTSPFGVWRWSFRGLMSAFQG